MPHSSCRGIASSRDPASGNGRDRGFSSQGHYDSFAEASRLRSRTCSNSCSFNVTLRHNGIVHVNSQNHVYFSVFDFSQKRSCVGVATSPRVEPHFPSVIRICIGSTRFKYLILFCCNLILFLYKIIKEYFVLLLCRNLIILCFSSKINYLKT